MYQDTNKVYNQQNLLRYQQSVQPGYTPLEHLRFLEGHAPRPSGWVSQMGSNQYYLSGRVTDLDYGLGLLFCM